MEQCYNKTSFTVKLSIISSSSSVVPDQQHHITKEHEIDFQACPSHTESKLWGCVSGREVCGMWQDRSFQGQILLELLNQSCQAVAQAVHCTTDREMQFTQSRMRMLPPRVASANLHTKPGSP